MPGRFRCIHAACSLALVASAATLTAQATPQVPLLSRPKVVLVELFTSEGCSSCPPADALLRQIDGTTTAAGQMILGISEHVTYWNSLGWADPFSSQFYTDRQNAYGTTFGLDSVYTPQMVVNGQQQFVGSDKSLLERALRKQLDQPVAVDLRILSTSISGTSLTVKFSAVGDASLRGADILAVLADDVDQSNVLRGENSGRTLAHASVARSMARVAQLQPAKLQTAEQQTAEQQTVKIQLPPAFLAKPGHHLILFAQAHSNGRILGADTKPI